MFSARPLGLIFYLIGLAVALFTGEGVRAEQGVSDTEILIGQSSGLTGQSAVQVKYHREGERILIDKVNAAGGVNGRKIKMIVLDDAYDPKKTVSNTERLIHDEKVFALFKYYGTPAAKAALPQIEKSGIPFIAPTTGAEFLYAQVRSNLFLVRPSYYDETEQIIDYLVEKRGAKKIALFRTDDGFGAEGHNGVQKALAKHNLKIVGESISRESTKPEENFKQLAESQPDAILMWTLIGPATNFYKAAKAAGFKGLIAGSTSFSSPEFAKTSDGVIMAFAAPLVDPNSPYAVVQQYIRDAKAAHLEPGSLAFRGYLDALILTEALKFAGRDLSRDSLRAAFETKLHDFDVGGIKLNYGPGHHAGLTKVFLGDAKNGKYEMFGP